jgi:hypothetical protein
VVAGVQVYAYVDRHDGALRVSVDLDTTEPWLVREDGTVPMKIDVGPGTVFDDTNAARGRQR